jgi:Ca2+-binding RTX toxin-like protein
MRRGALLCSLAAIVALVLTGAAGALTTVERKGDLLKLTGSNRSDEVSIKVIPGIADPSKKFYAIRDTDGVDSLPPGCFRFDEEEIHCPVEGVSRFFVDLEEGDDDVFINDNVRVRVDVKGGGGNDVLIGGSGGDDLAGGGGNDVERGGAGKDDLSGGAGRDRLFGGGAADHIVAGGGRDVLNGGGGRDTCNGGAGADTRRACERGSQ